MGPDQIYSIGRTLDKEFVNTVETFNYDHWEYWEWLYLKALTQPFHSVKRLLIKDSNIFSNIFPVSFANYNSPWNSDLEKI